MNAPEYQQFSYSVRDSNVVGIKHTETNQLAGELVWSDNTGRIEVYEVNPEHRGRGIVDKLWAEAHVYARDNDLTHPRHPEK